MSVKPRPVAQESLLKANARGVVTLPKELRGSADVFGAIRRPDGVIELRPKIVVDEAQGWFWDSRWQAAEREAQADIVAGHVREYDSAEAMFSDLDAHRASARP